MNNVRFRLYLPVIFLTLSVLLALWGEAQMDRWTALAIDPRTGNLHEPLNFNLERARFVDYAINTPAWAASRNMPFILPFNWDGKLWGFVSTEEDIWYLVFVALWWFFIGWLVDTKAMRLRSRRLEWGVSAICLVCAVLVLYTVIKFSFWNEPWFIWATAAWGVLLFVFAIYRFWVGAHLSRAALTR